MFLLFLLVFNSCNGLFSDDYLIREETTIRLKIFSVTSTPSLLFTVETADPEASNRAWPLLANFREEQRRLRAVAFLDDGWPVTLQIAQDVFSDYLLCRAINVEYQRRFATVDYLKKTYPNGAVFDHDTYIHLGFDYFKNALVEVKATVGKKISWPFLHKTL